MSEKFSFSSEEQQQIHEAEKRPIDSLPYELGFVETEELNQLHRQIANLIASGEDANELLLNYRLLAEKVVNSQQGEDFVKGQIGLVVQIGIIYRDSGQADRYVEELSDSLMYAENMGLEQVRTTINEELKTYSGPDQVSNAEELSPSQGIANILTSYGEEFGFDEDTVSEIAVMEFEEAFEISYSYLTQAGLNAEDVLADFMEAEG